MGDPGAAPAPGQIGTARLPAVVTSPEALRRLTREWTKAGDQVGLVPTMGSLHPGHLSLVARAQRECTRVVVSVFVNPLQFGQGEDYLAYPRQLESDLSLLAERGVQVCYCPAPETLYPNGFATRVSVEAGSNLWEAARRPGHFVGVATVVTKLFASTGPCQAYFGEKDAQQLAVVRRLAQDLDLGVTVIECATVRDQHGLALSSRNQLLSARGRESAICLSRALIKAAEEFQAGVLQGDTLARAAASVIETEPGVELHYAAVVDPSDFEPVAVASAESRVLVAAQVEGVSLIDTSSLDRPPRPSR
ncbi:MAG: pantoate--beta-alanine ligase [Candidatus Dormiibacterota bacterium]